MLGLGLVRPGGRVACGEGGGAERRPAGRGAAGGDALAASGRSPASPPHASPAPPPRPRWSTSCTCSGWAWSLRPRRTATSCTRRTRWPTPGTPRSPPASGTRRARRWGWLPSLRTRMRPWLRTGLERPPGAARGRAAGPAACRRRRARAAAHHLVSLTSRAPGSRPPEPLRPNLPRPPRPFFCPPPPSSAAQEAVRGQPGGHGGQPVCARHRLQLRQPGAGSLVVLSPRGRAGGAPHAAPQVSARCACCTRCVVHAAHAARAAARAGGAHWPAGSLPRPRAAVEPSLHPLKLYAQMPKPLQQCWHWHACLPSSHGTLFHTAAGGLHCPIWRAPAANRANNPPQPLLLYRCCCSFCCSSFVAGPCRMRAARSS